jgi:hypothetical protein
MDEGMSPTTRYVVTCSVGALVALSVIALGHHHQKVTPPPASAHVAPRQARSLAIEQHPAIENVPTAPVTL